MKKILLLLALTCSITVSGQSIKISHSDSSFFHPETSILRSDLSDGYYEVYYDNLKASRHYEGLVQSYQRRGTWTWYSIDGKKVKEANYSSGQLKGTYKEYHANGQLKTQVEIINGFPEGTMLEFWSNGIKKAEGSFSDGARSGLRKFWDESGTPIRESLYEKGIEVQK